MRASKVDPTPPPPDVTLTMTHAEAVTLRAVCLYNDTVPTAMRQEGHAEAGNAYRVMMDVCDTLQRVL